MRIYMANVKFLIWEFFRGQFTCKYIWQMALNIFKIKDITYFIILEIIFSEVAKVSKQILQLI